MWLSFCSVFKALWQYSQRRKTFFSEESQTATDGTAGFTLLRCSLKCKVLSLCHPADLRGKPGSSSGDAARQATWSTTLKSFNLPKKFQSKIAKSHQLPQVQSHAPEIPKTQIMCSVCTNVPFVERECAVEKHVLRENLCGFYSCLLIWGKTLKSTAIHLLLLVTILCSSYIVFLRKCYMI